MLKKHYPDATDLHHQLGDMVEAALNQNIPRLTGARPVVQQHYTHKARTTREEIDAAPAANLKPKGWAL